MTHLRLVVNNERASVKPVYSPIYFPKDRPLLVKTELLERITEYIEPHYLDLYISAAMECFADVLELERKCNTSNQ